MTNLPPDNKPPREWTSNEVFGFLESKTNDHNFSQDDINNIREKAVDVDGKAFLRWTVELLTNYFGIGYKSANSIMDLVEEKKLSDWLQLEIVKERKLSDLLQSLKISTPGE